MPPRIQPHRISIPSSTQCFRTRPEISIMAQQPFSSSPSKEAAAQGQTRRRKRMTRLRRDMFAWLNGPGKVFRESAKNSTNYMSAYDKSGNLIRARRQRQEKDEAREQVVPEDEEPEIQRKEEEEGLDEVERDARFLARQAARERKAELDARGGVPKERLSDLRPFPLNPHFRSQPVLSEGFREIIYNQVVERGVDVSTVSAAFGVDTRRVAAVARLKTIEKKWVAEGKQLAKPYNDAVLGMLPQTRLDPNNPGRMVPHESINDLPVHPYTRHQMFWPTSESRQFTREDAAKAFNNDLLPADKRIPHPELITLEKESLEGVSRDDRWARQQQRDEDARKEKEEAEAKRIAWEQRTQRVVPGRRWDFKFQDISVDSVGKDGRSRHGVGARYGMPHEDRKRGMVKIPTSVE
ncbi:Hypothetical predicted protein [Lecanosticta acicola]|uniref:Uncharacterized protein n=1 Tax=Lecanosticta acicola TaxID=111012 RepID=A0AAI8Z0G8_9PEZI|nr:Hypothetical predicted protein [Lecanosticta acicola]